MAVSLYGKTFQILLKIDLADGDSWSHLYGSFCCLRESVMCNVCRKLAINPVRPLPSRCKHNICRRCVGSKSQLKSHCKWCSEFKNYEENSKIRQVLQCYKNMCKYIMTDGTFCNWRRCKLSSPMLKFVSLVYEGAELEDNYHSTSKVPYDPVANSRLSTILSKFDVNNQSVNGQRTGDSMEVNDANSVKLMIESVHKEFMLSNTTDSDGSSDASEFNDSPVIQECLRIVKKWKNCQCDMSKRKPGKLTCCGQKCPCYVEGRACISCRCRGCKNPEQNLISSPPIHRFRFINVASPEPNNNVVVNKDVDRESFEDTSWSDSDKDPSV